MIVNTKYGKISGVEKDTCIVYKGIPYAKPPVGSLRFCKPQKPENWIEIYEARQYRARSMQRGVPKGSFYDKEFYSDPNYDTEVSEDCLYLNIWVPKKKRDEKFPVALWIHGGAFLNGGGSNLPFDGEEMTKRDVILVTINYRLGIFGFLCHPLLEDTDSVACSGNYGLWDQLEALNWVRENIGDFYGDPSNITLFGQSAGAMSLQILAVSPATEGKYQRMILQSGGGYNNPMKAYRTTEEAHEIGEYVLEELGIAGRLWKESQTKREEARRRLYSCTSQELLQAAGKAFRRSYEKQLGLPYLPVIDGELLQGDVNKLIAEGSYHKTSYILGANAEDLSVAMEAKRTQETNLMHRANVDFAQMVNNGGHARAYVYYFSRQLPGDDSGAFHSAELWYMFGSMKYCWRPFEEKDLELSKKMVDYWCNFMHNGNPNYENTDEWKCCTKENPYVEVFDIT